ncbi:MAG: poly-beta-1,6-N-acetyl-D-glucosamine biosynthesis protein PgaD [Pusillimonas sp.]
MIITTQRSRLAWAIDSSLTALGWAGFFFLFTRGVISILAESHGTQAAAMPLPPTVQTLVLYAAVACLNAGLVVLWGKYRKHFFTALKRNPPQSSVDDAVVASHFHLSSNQLHEIQGSRITVIHHSSDGDIDHLETDQLRMRPAENNSVYEESVAKVA